MVLPTSLVVERLGVPCWGAGELLEMEAASSLVEESWDGVLETCEVLAGVCEVEAVSMG